MPRLRKRKGLGWKVVWWFDQKRYVMGKRDARTAWLIYWRLRGKSHVEQGPELWNGRKRIL